MLTENLIEMLKLHRQERISASVVIAAMADNEVEALERLDSIKALAQEKLTEIRKKNKGKWKYRGFEDDTWHGVIEIVNEVYPIIEQIKGLQDKRLSDQEGLGLA